VNVLTCRIEPHSGGARDGGVPPTGYAGPRALIEAAHELIFGDTVTVGYLTSPLVAGWKDERVDRERGL
jgi:hypothetical protein